MTGDEKNLSKQFGYMASRLVAKFDRFDIIVVLFLVISSIAVSTLSFAPKKLGDKYFHEEAKALSLAVRGEAPWSDVIITRAPAPVLYYLIPYLAVPQGSEDDTYWLAAFIWTIGWMSIAALLLRRTGEMIGGSLAGKLAVLLTVLSPFQIYYSHGITGESPAYIGVVLFTYGYFRWQRTGKSWSPFKQGAWLVWIGLSLLVLSRPNAALMIFIGLLAAAVLWKLPEKRKEAKFIIASMALVIFAVLISSISVRVFLNSQQSENFAEVVYFGRFQYRTEPWDWRFWDNLTRQGSNDYAAWVEGLAEFKRKSAEESLPLSSLLWGWVGNDIIEHPGLTIQMAGVRTLALHLTFINSQKPEAFKLGPFKGWAVYMIFHVMVNAINLVLIVASLWFLFMRRSNLAANWPLWAPWLALLIFHAATYAEPRYLFPSRPGLAIMTAVSLAIVIGRARDYITINKPLAKPAQL
jgi:4-amino-4-deoxy-L-arabinose transferase-like glycosyltransferase